MTVTLETLTGDLGNNLLWDVREPQKGDVFEAQDWVFSPPGDGSEWKIPARSAFSGTRQPDGSYTSDGSAACEGVPRAPVLRHLVIDSASGEPAESFEGTLTIHWACGKDQPVDASFSVSGTR